MAIPDVRALMLPVLAAIASGNGNSQELRRRIAENFELTEADLAETLSGGIQTVFTNRVSWAIVSLQSSGLIEKAGPKRYRATDAGLKLLSEKPNSIGFKPISRSSATLREEPAGNTVSVAVSPLTPLEQIDRNYNELGKALAEGVLQRVREMPPRFFEKLILQLLTRLGYGGGDPAMGETIGRPGDGGVDGVIKEDALGLDRIYIQAKRYAPGNTVGRPEIQAFAGSLEGQRATKGIFMTTSSFSSGAEEYVKQIAKQIVLIDGSRLAEMMVDRGVGVRTVRIYEVKSIDESFFDEEAIA